MLKFQIDDNELEETIHNNYGENTDSLVRDFVSFLREKQIQNDVSISIEQLKQGKGIAMPFVMEDLQKSMS